MSEIHKSRKKGGTPSPHCQHLIRSGIKHFVTVQAEQRGRDVGVMNAAFVPCVASRCTNLTLC